MINIKTKNFLILFLISILISSTFQIQWRMKDALCKTTSTPTLPSSSESPVICLDGYVKIGDNTFKNCVDCIVGAESTFEYKLNSEKIFGSDGWTLGVTVGQTLQNTDNLLGLTYNSGSKTFTFTKPSTSQYEIVVILRAGSCGTPYHFLCTSFSKVQEVLFSTKGVDKGTGQDLEKMTYYYKKCPETKPIQTCTVSKQTSPSKTGTYDCTNFATVSSVIDGVLTNSKACFGSYLGTSDDDSCKADVAQKVCLYRVLNSKPSQLCGVEMCFAEKINVKTKINYGSYLGIIVSTGRTGTFDINPNLKGPFVLTMNTGDAYSAYYFESGYKGSWTTNYADLVSSSLWVPCSSGLSIIP